MRPIGFSAGVLRANPKINWDKHRGKDHHRTLEEKCSVKKENPNGNKKA